MLAPCQAHVHCGNGFLRISGRSMSRSMRWNMTNWYIQLSVEKDLSGHYWHVRVMQKIGTKRGR